MDTSQPSSAYASLRYARITPRDPRHLRRIRSWVKLEPGERTLEVGAGIGHVVKSLRAEGVDAIGVDVNPYAVRQGVTDALALMGAGELGFPPDWFDAVLSFHAIEHVPDLDGALAEMSRVLAPGGRMLLVYPAEPIRGLYAVPASLILHGTPWRARDIHVRTVTPRSLRERIVATDLPLVYQRSRLSVLGCPQFETLLRKIPR